MTTTPAYVNWGRWVIDCPECGDARLVVPGQAQAVCVNGHLLDVDWPDPATVVAVGQALDVRPEERTRNWLPAGHPWGPRYGLPTGQTAAELDAETAAHADEIHAHQQKRRRLLDALADAGIAVDAEGRFHGRID